MEEPLLELWPLLSNDSSFDMNRLKLFPDWMRQELVNLDYSVQLRGCSGSSVHNSPSHVG